jgi:hypothetical protein
MGGAFATIRETSSAGARAGCDASHAGAEDMSSTTAVAAGSPPAAKELE